MISNIHTIFPVLILLGCGRGFWLWFYQGGLYDGTHCHLKGIILLMLQLLYLLRFLMIGESQSNVLNDFIRYRNDHLGDPLSEKADILRFLVHCLPQGFAAPYSQRKTQYSQLNANHSYARRLLLMSVARHDPTRDPPCVVWTTRRGRRRCLCFSPPQVSGTSSPGFAGFRMGRWWDSSSDSYDRWRRRLYDVVCCELLKWNRI